MSRSASVRHPPVGVRAPASAPTGDAEVRAAMDALRRLVRALRGSARAAERGATLSAAQLFVLRAIAAEPGIALGDLAERTHTRQSTASEVVARLVARDLVERRVDPGDARRSLLHLTTAGRALVRTARRSVPERLVEALETMPPAERAALARGLTQWVSAAGLEAVAPTMFFDGPGAGARGGRRSAGPATAR